jgi:uncharacterized protein (TIGR02302 family)
VRPFPAVAGVADEAMTDEAIAEYGYPRPRFRLALTWAVLLWERTWRAAWAPLAVVGAYLALALFGLPQSLPGGVHAGLIAVSGVGALVAAWWGGRGFVFPRMADAKRRLESDNGLLHRPLQMLDDRPAGDDPLAMALWDLHRERVRDALGRLRVGWPRPAVIERDPFALRVLVALMIALAGIGAWGEWPLRIHAAFTPHFTIFAPPPPPALDVWITPPDYTGLPPQFLRMAGQSDAAAHPAAEPVAVAKGSAVQARVRGGDAPRLEANDTQYPFDTVEPGTYQIRRAIESGGRIAVLQRTEPLAGWSITVVGDRLPTASFTEPPAAGPNGALRIAYTADDDYGLTALSLRVRPVSPSLGAPIEIPLSLPGGRPKQASAVVFQDLTPHPWAGLPVALSLAATDGAGQTGTSAEVQLVLPERNFGNPVAQAVIAVRKELVASGDAARQGATRRLLELGAKPDGFRNDVVVALALRSAAVRLLIDRTPEAVPSVIALLWDTALRIEDGLQSVAERELRDAQNRLSEALERGAGEEELAKLMDQLRSAIEQYFAAMDEQLRQALQRGEQVPQIPPELADRMNVVDPADLQSMLDRMRTLAETGSRDAARQMLSEIQQMLENMRAGTVSPGQQNQQRQAIQILRDIKDLANRQQQLLDEAFRAAQNGDTSRGRDVQAGSPLLQGQAERQEQLRKDLGDVMRRFGELGGQIPDQFGEAEKAMRGAVQSLKRGQPGTAASRETQALEALRKGGDSLTDQLARQMAGGGSGGAGPAGQGGGRDPLGRRPGGMGGVDNGDVHIPGTAEIQRAREILDELRRRAGEFARPKVERDYIDRLLRQF